VLTHLLRRKTIPTEQSEAQGEPKIAMLSSGSIELRFEKRAGTWLLVNARSLGFGEVTLQIHSGTSIKYGRSMILDGKGGLPQIVLLTVNC
jgi:hypothetical protein